MFDRVSFEAQKTKNIDSAYGDYELRKRGIEFIAHSDKFMYGYNWSCLGLPIIQMPEDIVLMQELVWELKPDVIIEAGIAWGGSLALYAMIQEIIGNGVTIGIDLTIPEHNRDAIMKIPVSHRIKLIQGSSISDSTINEVSKYLNTESKVLVILDSDHSHQHVLKELHIWSEFVTKGSYLVVSDTIVEDIPLQTNRPRPWGPGNNPKTALVEFLGQNPNFTDKNIFNRRAINSFSPGGYLQRI